MIFSNLEIRLDRAIPGNLAARVLLPAVFLQGFPDQIFINFCQVNAFTRHFIPGGGKRSRCHHPLQKPKVASHDLLIVFHENNSLNHIFQFPYVAFPTVIDKVSSAVESFII